MSLLDNVNDRRVAIPFHLRGRNGQILARLSTNQDPVRWGMQRLGLSIDLTTAQNFPVLHAEIRYDGEGYDAMMGWIQILDIRSQTSGQAFRFLDRFAAFDESGSPFNTFGYLPTLFDAPVIEALPGSFVTWRADTYLAVLPDIGMSRKVAALLGFRWGFEIENQQPRLASPVELNENAWRDAIPYLGEQCPGWELVPQFSTD